MGISDPELAQVIGSSRPHVQAVRRGAYAEHLTTEQARNLMMYCRLVRDRAIDAVAEMELMA